MKPIIRSSAALCFAAILCSLGYADYPAAGRIVVRDPALNDLIDPDAKIEVLAEGLSWSEGPVWISDGGYLLASDIPNNRIVKWSEAAGMTTYLKQAGGTERENGPGSNGLILDAQGRLVLCQHGDRRLALMDAPLSNPQAKFRTLAAKFDDLRLNSPNDAVYHSNGDLYFTDPPYGLDGDSAQEIEFQGVYRLGKDGAVTLLSKELSRPNGIGFSPDYKTLYVANSDILNPVWLAFPVHDDGSVGESRIFFDARKLPKPRPGGGNDGLKVDALGNLFATGPGGVVVFSPDGKHLGTIMTGDRTANCAFGDDGSTLYMTVNTKLMRVRTKTKGIGF